MNEKRPVTLTRKKVAPIIGIILGFPEKRVTKDQGSQVFKQTNLASKITFESEQGVTEVRREVLTVSRIFGLGGGLFRQRSNGNASLGP